MHTSAHIIEKIAGWGTLAGFGGAVKYISVVIRSSEKISKRRFVFMLVANIFISCFCGLMGGLLMTALALDATWQWVGCGAFGYAGTQSVDILILMLQKKINPSGSFAAVIPVPPSVNTAQ